MTDLERELRAALREEAAAVDTRLTFPAEADGRPSRAVATEAPRRRRLIPVLAAAAASVALVMGVMWGAQRLPSDDPAEPAGSGYTHQVHGPDDIPKALGLLPGVLDGIKRLQPVEDAAIHRCLIDHGIDVPPPYPDLVIGPTFTDSADLDPQTASREGYGLKAAIAAQRAETAARADAARRYGPRWEHPFDTAFMGPLDDPWAKPSFGQLKGVETRYGGCVAQGRRDVWGADALARLDMDLWPGRTERYPGSKDGDPQVASVQARHRACLAASGVPTLLARSMATAGVTPDSNRYVAGTDVDEWLNQMTIALGRDSTPTPKQLAAVLADEKRIAAIDARCSREVGLRAVLRAASDRSASSPAHLLRDEPRLLDEVFVLDGTVRRLLHNYGISKESVR